MGVLVVVFNAISDGHDSVVVMEMDGGHDGHVLS